MRKLFAWCRCAKPILIVAIVTFFMGTLLAVPIQAIARLVSSPAARLGADLMLLTKSASTACHHDVLANSANIS